MIAVITGDVVGSRQVKNPQEWIIPFKHYLNQIGSSPKVWEIYRGDSFQIKVPAEQGLLVAVRIKSIFRSLDQLDVKMGIGIGSGQYDSNNITESFGEAYLHSGECYNNLDKGNGFLEVRSPWLSFDEYMNISLGLATVIMNQWTPAASEATNLILENPDITQNELANKLNIKQSSVSVRIQRAHLKEILDLVAFFKKSILKHLQINDPAH